MVQWFSPGFSAYTQMFETLLMLIFFGVLVWAGEDLNSSCAAGLVLSHALNLVVFYRHSMSNVNFEIVQCIVFTIVRNIY